MARPKKQNVTYFPHNCYASKTLQILEQKYGNDGYVFFYKLFEVLGNEPGHFYDCREVIDFEFLAGKMGFSSGKLREILDNLRDWGKIDRKLWEKDIIWYQGFINTLEDAYKERTTNLPTIEECRKKTGVNLGLPEENSGLPEENQPDDGFTGRKPQRNTQIKGNKRKQNKIKQKENNNSKFSGSIESEVPEDVPEDVPGKLKKKLLLLLSLKKIIMGIQLGQDAVDFFSDNKQACEDIAGFYTSVQCKSAKRKGESFSNAKYKAYVIRGLIGNVDWDMDSIIEVVFENLESEIGKINAYIQSLGSMSLIDHKNSIESSRIDRAMSAYGKLSDARQMEIAGVVVDGLADTYGYMSNIDIKKPFMKKIVDQEISVFMYENKLVKELEVVNA